MKIISYKYKNNYGCGFFKDDGSSFSDKNHFLSLFEGDYKSLNEFLVNYISSQTNNEPKTWKWKQMKFDDVEIIAPLPCPNSFRDAYAFRQHVEAGRKNRGLDMIPEYDEFPVFYFSNHNSITGPGVVNVYRKHLDKLDFELEIAIVIGKEGVNIKASDANEYIFGYTIMNDWSARGLQMKEMKLNLGPAKGKDFATSIGPYITTVDALESYKVDDCKYDIPLSADINGVNVSRDNLKSMTWTFAEIIERASYGATLYPGDIIGSGTCGTGCFLEINGATDKKQWLQDGDVVEVNAGTLGVLSNKINLIK